MKKGICMILCVLLSIGITACSGGTKEVTDKEITIQLDEKERTGTYTGQLVDGVPNGKGKFESINAQNVKWTYEGNFENGTFNGQGKTTWEDGTVEAGKYKNGVWEISLVNLLETAAAMPEKDREYVDIFTVSLDFMREHENYFPANGFDVIQGEVNEGVSYKMLTKEIEKYEGKILKLDSLTTANITSTSEGEDKYTYILALDDNLNAYEFLMMGELQNIYNGDTLPTLYAMPVGFHSFENVGGGYTNTVMFAISYHE